LSQFVFVYGTLRKHEKYHHIIEGSKLVAEQAWTNGILYDTGNGYPALVSEGEQLVYGEVYSVNQNILQKLNELEGYVEGGKDNLYERKLETVFTDTGTYDAIIYYADPTSILIKTPIQIGDWKIHRIINKEDKIDYFAYGSCMDLERISLAGKVHLFREVLGAGKLPGYTIRFSVNVSDGGRADIVEEGGLVEGKVYRLNSEAIEYLYNREGVHTGLYRPAFVDIDINGKLHKNALTFIVCSKKNEVAPPDHYINEIYRGGKNILSESYVQALEEQVAKLRKR
jgi:gamma-glutamylcyclotransferase (GGCT)/AIG2-like uncharacterized protein YtfP